VSVVYGSTYNISTTSRTNQIGLRGATNADFNNRSGAAANPWNATSAGTSNSATVARNNTNFPASGLTFNWTPPSCLAPGTVAYGMPLTNSVSLSWTAVPAASIGYTIYYSTTNTAPTAATVLDANNSVTVAAPASAGTITG